MSLVVATSLALPGRLHSTDLELKAGTLTALVGPNGGGKTSLLHALARIGGASGRVLVAGDDPATLPVAIRIRSLAYLPAARELSWPISGRDLIALSGATKPEIDRIVERIDLEAFTSRRTDLLSTGERSRVLLARAMAPNPRLLLLDEPTANLDPSWQIRLMALLAEEVRGQNRAALVAMHDLDSALRFADRLIVMQCGGIAADGPPDEILRSEVIPAVFGIQRTPQGWTLAAIPAADR